MGSYRSEPIAIVGSACRFPGSANSPSTFWELLRSPRDVLKEFSPERLNLRGFYHRNGKIHGRTDVKNYSYLLDEDCRVFDASFFRISPKEAHGMDPQQRILLETVFEATEAAGWPLEVMEGSLTSVHVGCMTADYNEIQMRDPESLPTYTATGLAQSILANRISYFFDLKGPSIAVDTACSSSLVAIHLAVQGLRNGEAHQAIVAGVNLLLDPSMYIAESTLNMLSPDSRCRMWDALADGYARGEGCGVVVLKPLSKALADNDHIECVISETAINSDGRTNGITMPSAESQAELIKETYRRAGLDPVADGCQYFECHGTGTKAGDPVEARAIAEAFFPGQHSPKQTPLYCGSVKTIIGHLEGGAGIAGLLKACLAIQNKTIPPNMHFTSLNPALEPYYSQLCVPTSALPWPETNGRPLRASVNSFGFGGTNAHVILESYQESPRRFPRQESENNSKSKKKSFQEADAEQSSLSSLFVFSAKSQVSLLGNLSTFVKYIQSNPSIDLDALRSALYYKRSNFAFRVVIAASSRSSLLEALQNQVLSATASGTNECIIRSLSTDLTQQHSTNVLGVFTGQGAQWPLMGSELMLHSATFRESISKCERALSSLQESPSWSLSEEIATGANVSRLSRAEFSQPLCTAIQIALTDLLYAVGVRLEAVIGHSSGEIAAAYAAGIINVKDAMGIAYYRGLVADKARGIKGQRGGMMAVGISYVDATTFCAQSSFRGRITVAASNSPSSVTLSGDWDAIHEAKQLLEKNKTFTKILQVDTAYHSYHMVHCEAKYFSYLQQMKIQVNPSRPDCTWFSSVYPGVMESHGGQFRQLRDKYWVDNMKQAVLFSQAVQCALETIGTFALAFEIGPHPALKGPVRGICDASLGRSAEGSGRSSIPYLGCLERGSGDIEVMSNTFGLAWSYLGPSRIDLGKWHDNLRKTTARPESPVLKDLPTYSWQHDQVYWCESRLSHNYRLIQHDPHELLGRLAEVRQQEMTWRNILRVEEISWLRGHMFQGQVVFPGAGYVSMAVQAAKIFIEEQERGHSMQVVEIRDMSVVKAMVIEEDTPGVEVLFTMEGLERTTDNTIVEATFTVHACTDQRKMNKISQGHLLIHLEEKISLSLPPSMPILVGNSNDGLPSLDVDKFFSAIGALGITYEGPFHALRSIKRAGGHAKACGSWSKGELSDEYLLHPAMLDVAFQVGFASFLSMAEKAIGTAYLPTSLRSIVVDITQLQLRGGEQDEVNVESQLVRTEERNSSMIEVDLDVYDPKNIDSTLIQVEGLMFKPVGEPSASDDRLLFAKTVWDADAFYGIAAPEQRHIMEDELEYIDAVERTALYFLRTLQEQTPMEDIKNFKPHHQALFRAIDHLLVPIREGRHGVIKKDYLQDTRQTIEQFAQRYDGSVDLALLTAVGENLPTVVRGQSEILEHMMRDNLLGRLYTEGRGFSTCNGYVAGFMRQISHKHPRTRILEIGAGTGGTTASVLDAIGDAFVSYTYTDISEGFFERAMERFTDATYKMEFRKLNVEHSLMEQGFKEGSYDIIIAANVLHATRQIKETMRNVRSLLRPGGYLIAVEVTGSMLREPGLMGGLEGWWMGEEDGRFPSPGISAKSWDQVLQESGFSGIDTIAYDMPDISRHNCSSFVTQAMDERLEILRDPLSRMNLVPEASGPVLIFGGQTLSVSKCVQKAQKILRRWTPQIQIFTDLDDLDQAKINTTGAQVLYLAELDAPIFSRPLTQRRLDNLQVLFAAAQNVLWVTSESRADNPQAGMVIGIGRALAFELPHMRMQFLDFEKGATWDVDMMVQHLLRMVFLSSLPREESSQMLWSHEQEIIVANDVTLVSRVIMDEEANMQYNARRRRVEKSVGPFEHVEISYTAPRPSIVLPPRNWTPSEGQRAVEIALSTPLFIGASTSCFLAFGKCRASGASAVTLSNRDGSVVYVDNHNFLELAKDARMNAQHLSTIASALLGQCCVSLMPEYGTTLVLAPQQGVSEAVRRETTRLGRKVMFVTTSTQVQNSSGWLSIHPLERARTIRDLLPEDTVALLYFSDHRRLPERLLQALPKNCTIQVVNPAAARHRQAFLVAASEMASSLSCHELEIVNLDNIQHLGPEPIPTRSMLKWQERKWLSVTVPPLYTRGFFAANKTYLLVGMTGELGQSLCQFMVDCGARHIVLASRNPPIGHEKRFSTIDKTVALEVKMIKMDVTNQKEVQSVVSMIRRTMPEIAGVANAALILDDSLFANTTVPTIEKQLQPKVQGTSYLDEEFSTCNLDFFLCFSSLGSIFGNAGQSIYHAANMFLTSLIESRRRRGQAGSIIHIGMIIDAGYVARSTRSGGNIEKHLRSQSYMPLAENEFHHLVLQAVMVGQPNSLNPRYSSGEVIMGIQRFVDDPDAITRPQWYHDLRLSHMILPMSVSISQPSSAGIAGKKKELKAMLDKVSSSSEASEVYQRLFCVKIESMMKIPAASVDTTSPLSNLGLDSLLAVEIREWLLRDMRLEIPLLAILSRESVSSISTIAAQKFIEQRKTTIAEPFAVDLTATCCMDTDIDKEGCSDGNGITFTPDTTIIDGGLVSPLSLPLTPTEPTRDGGVDKQLDEPAPTSDDLLTASPIGITAPISLQYRADPIPVLDRVERMSYSQASMHFLQDFLDDATTFNVVAHYKVQGSLSVSRFQRALEKVVARHDAFRTRFHADYGGLEPMQYIATKKPTTSSESRLVHVASSLDSDVQLIFEELKHRKWQLAREVPFQCVLLTDSDGSGGSESNCNAIVVGCHHIIMDGMSWHIFLKDLNNAHRLLPLEPVPFTYADFSRQQLEDLKSGQMDECLAFWIRRLDPIPGLTPLLPLSHRRNRMMSRVYENHTVQKELALQVSRRIKAVAQGYQATPMQFYLVTLQVLLMQLLDLDNDELCIGVTVAGRGTSGRFEETIGHFTNLLPIIFRVVKQSSIADLVARTVQIMIEGYEHAHAPLEVILERLQIQRSTTSTPLFQIAFNYRSGNLLDCTLGNCQLHLVEYRDARTPYDLTLNVTQSSTSSQLLEITSNAYLYTKDATQRLLEMYTNLLDMLCSVDRYTQLCDLKLPSGDAACQDVSGSRSLKIERDWPKTLIERLQEVWIECPNSLAIRDNAVSLSYEELRVRTLAIARALNEYNILPGMHVAVLCNPAIDSYATMLAILWIGAVYIPLDGTLPAERHQAMMNVCKPQLLVFHGPTSALVEPLLNARRGEKEAAESILTCNLADIPCSTLSAVRHNETQLQDPPMTRGAEDYSFVLFTSGSTGIPKGIKLSQAGIMNYTASKSTLLGIAPGVRVLQQSSLGFDMAIAQVFNAFANAGTLVVAPFQARGDPFMITELMTSEAVEFTLATPTEYLMLTNYAGDALRKCTSWRYACSGGEMVTEGVINELQRLELCGLTLTDCYGPTEISCAATFRRINLFAREAIDDEILGESSSIGHCLPNTSIYIIGDDGIPLLDGQPGEICIGGCGVARGYLDKELNQGKFVQNHLATREYIEKGWGTMYKTGDRGCLLSDGSLAFLGRMDCDLIKLRGLRIELGEISQAILEASHGALTDTYVTIRGDPEFLVAHVVFAKGVGKSEQQELLARLMDDLPLPRYMVPSFIISLDRVPTTPNGKVDRLAIASLPLLRASEKEEDTASQPLPVAQGELRLLWREVLGDVVVRADTDFFTVGGSSLLLVRLQNLLKERMGIYIALHELYESSTLRRMAVLASNERSLVLNTEGIDWELETAISSEVRQVLHSGAVPPAQSLSTPSHLHILLTGATGFLGCEILRVLIAEQNIAEIHCIAVPAADKQVLLDMSNKIHVYTGSLSSPALGLSNREQQLLQTNVHCIVHAGAQGHCLNNYGSVRQANYLSTQFLTSLALPHRVPIHYISSPRVILQAGEPTSNTKRSMAEYPPCDDGLEGYTASKWASERFLERVVAVELEVQTSRRAPRSRQLAVVIHRACSLVGDRAPHDDAMNAVIRYSLLSGQVPHLPNARGFFDFKDVADVARDIAHDITTFASEYCSSFSSSFSSIAGRGSNNASFGSGAVVYRHHSSNVRMPFNELASRLEILRGGKFTVVSMSEWLRSALELGIEELIVSYIQANLMNNTVLMFPYMGN